MLSVTHPVPSTPERIRSTCVRAGGALLAIEHENVREDPVATPIHHLLDDGSFAVGVPASLGGDSVDGSQVLLELTDFAPLPVREPVRSLVWVRGRLRQVPPLAVTEMLDTIATENPNPALLQIETPQSASINQEGARYHLMRLEIASVLVTDATGAEPVSIADLLDARPDPFCEIESSLLRHLAAAHSDIVTRLVSRLPPALRRGRVRLLGLDRYGMRFRVEDTDGDHDIRLPFHRPVDDMTGLSQAIRVLLGCPFVNGLRARQ